MKHCISNKDVINTIFTKIFLISSKIVEMEAYVETWRFQLIIIILMTLSHPSTLTMSL